MTELSVFANLLAAARRSQAALGARMLQQAADHPTWLASVDARTVGLQEIWNVLRFAELSLVFVQWHLSDDDWWIRLRGSQPSHKELSMDISAYASGSKFGVFHLGTASFENAIRCLLRALAPGAAKNGKGEFKSVYECLLRTHLRFPEDDLQLLELIRLVRNTIHNSGVHMAISGGSTAISFRGQTYAFPDSGPVEFVTWTFVIDRVSDLHELLYRICEAPKVQMHRARIAADWADVYVAPAT